MPIDNTIKSKKNYVPWLVFIFSITIVLISSLSVVFPSLLISSDVPNIPDIIINRPNHFEINIFAVPLIIIDTAILFFTFLYFKNKLPSFMYNSIRKLFKIEVSKKETFLAIVIILTIYIVATAGELAEEEYFFDDYEKVKERAINWSIERSFEKINQVPVKIFLLHSSLILFGNIRVIPFIASIALLILTYLITQKIANCRFAGLIAIIVVMQSNIFLEYDTVATYSNFWILFYLLSLYLMYNVWPLSLASYLFSIPAKALTAAFFPMSLYFIFRASIPTKRKIILAISIVTIIIAGLTFSMISNTSLTIGILEPNIFDANDFWIGFAAYASQLRFDTFVLISILPLIVGLFIASKNGIKHAESVMILISGILLIPPILTGLTDQTNQPYRFVPLIVFIAMGIGVLLSKKKLINFSDKSPN